jgi:L-lactate dehydrogenase (cytochrome)
MFLHRFSGRQLTPLAGEANITRGAAQTGIIQMVSSNASLSYSAIVEAATPSQTLFFQLYKHANDSIAEQRVREVDTLGYKAIFLTVDAIVAGNRERDIRNPWELEDEEKGTSTYWSGSDALEKETNGMGTAGALVANDDRDMTWEKVSIQGIFSCAT